MYTGFHGKLQKRHRELSEQFALVWTGDSHLKKFYRQRNPYIRNVKNMTSVDRDSHQAGQQIGKKLEIVPGLKPKQSPPSERQLLLVRNLS